MLGSCDVATILHGFPEPKIVTQSELPLELSYREGKGGLVILSGRVNGKGEVDFVLDTGAPVTVLIDGERTSGLGIDTSNARRLGPSDDPAAPIGVIRGGLTLAFGDVTLRGLTAVVLPESGGGGQRPAFAAAVRRELSGKAARPPVSGERPTSR